MLISKFFPAVGGTEAQAMALSRALIRNGHDVKILTSRLPGTESFETVQDIPVHRISPHRNFLTSILFIIRGFLHVAFARPRIDIVHAHLFYSPSILASLCGILLRKKTISKLGRSGADGDVRRNLATLAGRIKLSIFKRSINLFIAVNEEIRDELLSIGVPQGRIQMIPNGVDTETFCPAAPAEKEKLKSTNSIPFSPCALYLGRLIPRKRIHYLIPMWAKVVEKFPDAGLMIVGDGEMRGTLEALVRKLGIARRVCFTGVVMNPVDYLRCADVFILPSETEGISNSLLQAMSCAVPVVVAKNSGADALIDDERNGFIIDVEKADETRKIIERLLASESLRAEIGEGARKTILERYSIQSVAKEYEKVYCELLKDDV
ncbi:MAG: glycosyltransferase family 4 protein [bacterium]